MEISYKHYIWADGVNRAGLRVAFFSKLEHSDLIGLELSSLSVKEILDLHRVGLDKIYRLAITRSDDRDPAQEYDSNVLAIWQVEQDPLDLPISVALSAIGFEPYDGDWGDNSIHYTDAQGNELTLDEYHPELLLTHSEEPGVGELTDKQIHEIAIAAQASGYEFYIQNPYSRKFKPKLNLPAL